ncbi:MAG TPA: PAS domain S-box protein [Deltaproteobacteria bacterium]|nr:PAS domain S-box protein [Deltaproteobacteria bacterium]
MELTDPQQHLKKVSRELPESKTESIEAREILRCVLQNTNDLVFATDLNGAIVSFSKSTEEVLGYRGEQIKGKHSKELAEDSVEFERMTGGLFEDGMVNRSDFPFRHADGHPVYCDVSFVALKDSKGKSAGCIVIARDITEWKKFQEELIRVDRLAEVGRTVSGTVHEINNPLAVINEISGWMGVVVSDSEGLNDDDRADLKTSIEKLLEQATRCRNIARQMLDFVRDSGPAGDSFDLHELLRNSVSFIFPELKSKDVEVLFDLMEGPLQMHSEPRMLEQVFVNLLTNAIHAIEEKGNGAGHIQISTRLDEKSVVISIADNGTGIAPRDQKKIFELFYTTKPSGKGTGLGLPICRNIVHKLGGAIHVESTFWKGATFVVRIPIRG